MGKFNFESLMKAANRFIENEATALQTPQNSEYRYLTVLDENDISFNTEYVRVITPQIEYKVSGYYTSRLDVEDKERETTYSSSFSTDPSKGVMISKSRNYQKIPAEYMQTVETYINGTILTESDIKQRIIEDARPKVKAKVRRTKDLIEDDDIKKIEISEHKIKKTTHIAVEWSEIIRKSDGFVIAVGYGHEGSSAEYQFNPDPNYKPVEENFKQQEDVIKNRPKEKKKTKKISISEIGNIVGRCFGKMCLAVIVAALLLVVEFIVLLATNLFGVGNIFNASPGVYDINSENYRDYIMIRQPYSNYYIEVEEGEKQTQMPKQTSSEMSNYSLFQIVPANASIALFDLDQKESVRYYRDYKPGVLSPTIRKYEISDLYIRYEVTYCYNGNVQTTENEMYFQSFSNLENAYLTADFPQESMQSATHEYVSNMKGDTYTQTVYWPGVEYWSVKILEISGVAEVKEEK